MCSLNEKIYMRNIQSPRNQRSVINAKPGYAGDFQAIALDFWLYTLRNVHQPYCFMIDRVPGGMKILES
jgi:hypothetical protein